MIYVNVQNEKVPALGFGTWQLSGNDCAQGVAHALSLGYRHIDTAQGYDNEARVGEGLKKSGVSRGDVFLTTKVKPDNFTHDKALSSTRESLNKLGTDYVDLLLLHWPNPDVPLEETLGALLELQRDGAVKHIGVSNFTPSLVEEAFEIAPVFCNQVEYHPYLAQDKLRTQARERGYMLTAYSPVAQGEVMDDEALSKIGERHGKNAVQVTLRWLLQQEQVAAIPKASSAEHRESNFDIFDFSLSDDEMQEISDLNKGERMVDPDDGPDWER